MVSLKKNFLSIPNAKHCYNIWTEKNVQTIINIYFIIDIVSRPGKSRFFSAFEYQTFDTTVPEKFLFPIFDFAHRSLTVRSLSVHTGLSVRSSSVRQSLTVHSFAFTVQRALAFTAHKAFIVRSPCV